MKQKKWIKIVVLVSFGILFPSSGFAHTLELSDEVLRSSRFKIPFHSGKGKLDSYLAIDVPYGPIKALQKKVEDYFGVTLKSRGEAHITVVTPVEHWKRLRRFLDIKDLHRYGEVEELQSMKYSILCVGRGQRKLKENLESTFFVVLDAPEVVEFRRGVQKLMVLGGGKQWYFKPERYYPHITIGFTKRDLHVSDGIVKGRRTCVADIKLIKE